MFSAIAEGMWVSACRTIISKMLSPESTMTAAEGSSSGNPLKVAELPTDDSVQAGFIASHSDHVLRKSHAFSGRIEVPSSSSSWGSIGEWNVAVRLQSFGPEPPNMLVGFGMSEPRSSAEAPESPDMFDARVLTTPMIWEEPGFAFLECSDKAPRLWSDTLGYYGAAAPSTADPCFSFRAAEGCWEALFVFDCRTEASKSDGRTRRFAVARQRHDGSGSEELLVVDPIRCSSSGEPDGQQVHLAPYVTLLQHQPSLAQIVSVRCN